MTPHYSGYLNSWMLKAGVLTYLWESDADNSLCGGERGGLVLPPQSNLDRQS